MNRIGYSIISYKFFKTAPRIAQDEPVILKGNLRFVFVVCRLYSW